MRGVSRSRKCDTPWALMIDADEALDDVLRDAIVAARRATREPTRQAHDVLLRQPMRLWRNEPLLRLFRTARATARGAPGRGRRAPSSRTLGLRRTRRRAAGTLLHFSYPDYASYRVKYDAIRVPRRAACAARTGGAGCALMRAVAFLVAPACQSRALATGSRGVYVAYKSAMYPAVVVRRRSPVWARGVERAAHRFGRALHRPDVGRHEGLRARTGGTPAAASRRT